METQILELNIVSVRLYLLNQMPIGEGYVSFAPSNIGPG